jgi:hypothetical protein
MWESVKVQPRSVHVPPISGAPHCGMTRTYSLVTSVPRAALSLSNKGAVVVTSTVVITPSGCNGKSIVVCWSTCSKTFFLLFGLPEARAVHRDCAHRPRAGQDVQSVIVSVCRGGEAGGVVSDRDGGRRNHGTALVLDDSSNLGRVTGLPKCRRRKRQHHQEEPDGNTTQPHRHIRIAASSTTAFIFLRVKTITFVYDESQVKSQ